MSRRAGLAGLLVLLAAWLAAAPVGAAAAAPSADLVQQIQAQEQDLQQLQQQMANTQHDLVAARATLTSLQGKVSSLAGQVATQQAYINGLEKQLGDAQARLQTTETGLAATEQALTAQQKTVGLRMQALYEYGTVDYLSVLMSAHSFTDLINRFVFITDILRADVAALQTYRQARVDAEQQQKQAQAQRDQVAHLQAAADDALQAYRTRLTEAQAAAGQVKQVVAKYQTEADAQAASSAQVQQTLSSLRVRYTRTQGGFAFIWPVDGHIIITSPFGQRFHPILHIWELHSGVDIGEDTGTPIHAAESGVVVQVGYLNGYGNTVVIDHGTVKGHDIASLYAHQSRTVAVRGQVVQQGDLIGYVGMTGWATGPHLHFEVRVDGTPVNPIDWLPPAP